MVVRDPGPLRYRVDLYRAAFFRRVDEESGAADVPSGPTAEQWERAGLPGNMVTASCTNACLGASAADPVAVWLKVPDAESENRCDRH